MTFTSAQSIQIAPNGFILLLLDENDKVIVMRLFTSEYDVNNAAQIAQELAEATASTGKTVDEAIAGLQDMLANLAQQCADEGKSAKKSRRKVH